MRAGEIFQGGGHDFVLAYGSASDPTGHDLYFALSLFEMCRKVIDSCLKFL